MNKSHRVAIIDCGTNTFHLLIADTGKGRADVLHAEKTTVKIGQGGIGKKVITDEAAERAVTCIARYAARIREAGAGKVYAFATSAFRNASNGRELRDRIRSETGIEISIIPGDDEAGLILDGVRYAIDLGETPVLVMDIGGGSVEFIIATQEERMWQQSFEIGAQRLLDRFYEEDPITESSVLDLQLFLAQELSPLAEAADRFQPSVLIGASGTFDTLSSMYLHQIEQAVPENAGELPLTVNAYYKLHEALLHGTREERLAIPGMVEMRVDMIVVASCLIDFVLKMTGIDRMRVSTYALKEGALWRLINQAS